MSEHKQTPPKDNTSKAYLHVALPVPLHRTFEYSVCTAQLDSFPLGGRALVPFGKKYLIGMVVGKANNTEFQADKIKPATQAIDCEPIYTEDTLSLASWLSDFYIFPLGEVYACMLPTLLRKVSLTKQKTENANRNNTGILENIADINLKVTSADLAPQEYLQHIGLNDIAVNVLQKSKKQAQLYNELKSGDIVLSEAKSKYSLSIIKGLLNKNAVRINKKAFPCGQWQQAIELGEKKRANPEQAIAIASINQASSFTAFLLEGVTGSGKTEVYLQVIEDVILQGKQVLILVPEIGLTPQTVSRFEQRFGNVVSVWHSALTDHERLHVWKQAKYNQTGIIIGTRSAVFLPLAAPGMIIVDEEHDESFKQQDSLRYHARDVAAYRAKQFDISLVLGSATPSLESLHNALSKKYRHIELTQRAGNASMPSQHLVDLTGVPLQAGIAPSMLTRIEQQLKEGSQVLIYVNRRGYAPALICGECGHVESCDDCDNPYTLHVSTNNLQCHRCGQMHNYIYKCRQCHSPNMTTQGVGTEQIHNILAKHFSEYSCVRIDSDSTRGKHKLNKLLSEIDQNKHQILVGTQILSKGHHFPNVTLALILNVDSFLFSSDYRASEKLAQLVTQFSGRAGRANKPGEVWLQSFQMGHPLLQDLVNNGYAHFSRLLLHERIAAKLPPAQWQIAIRVEHSDKALIMNFMQYANQLLSQFEHLTYVGPFPAGIEKKQTRFRFITVAQSSSNKYINSAMKQVKEALLKHKLSAKIRWALDVMPTDFS